MKRYWTDEERAILREVYAANPDCRGRAGAGRHAELLRRLPGRTWPSIHNQIVVMGLAHHGIPTKQRKRAPVLSGRAYECLDRHGPLTVRGVAELLGTSIERATNAVGHLASKKAICPSPDKHCWQIVSGPTDWSRTQRQPDGTIGITDEDLEWMRRYRAQRDSRIARLRQVNAGGGPCHS